MADRVRLKLEGLMCERFIDRAMESGARFMRVRRVSPREVELCADSRSAKLALALAKKYSMSCLVVEKRGFCALFDRIKRRKTFAAAIIVSILLSFLILSRVWRVDIELLSGAVPVGARELLAEMGISPGVRRTDVDAPLAALRLRSLEGCSHASVSLRGSTVLVELAGEIDAPEVFDIGAPRSVYAARDCVIASIEVRAGEALVKPGDTVRAGQPLIAGQERVSNESSAPVGALGVVRGRIWFEGASDGAMSRVRRRYTGEESVSARVSLFELSVPLTAGAELIPSEARTERFAIVGMFLPLNIERTRHLRYEDAAEPVDIAALDALLSEAALADAEAQIAASGLENVKIVDKWTEYSIIDTDTRRARCYIEVEADVAAYLEE